MSHPPLIQEKTESKEILPINFNQLEDFQDVNLMVEAQLGQTHMRIRDFLALAPDALIELPVSEGDYIGVLANNKLIARGEIIVVEGSVSVRVTEVVAPRNAPNEG